MFSINDMNGGRWLFAIETRPDAIMTSARSMALAMVGSIDLPMIVVDHGSVPPDDKGDRVIIKAELLHRSTRLMGPRLAEMAPGVDIYRLEVG